MMGGGGCLYEVLRGGLGGAWVDAGAEQEINGASELTDSTVEEM